MSQEMSSCVSSLKILTGVEGLDGKKNDIIYHPGRNSVPGSAVVYFGGDIQDYREKMQIHRDHKVHVKWSLEETAILLHDRFPESDIFVVKPLRMHLNTFSCYDNFVEGNNFGVPNHSMNTDSLRHLMLLLRTLKHVIYNSTFHDISEQQECFEMPHSESSDNQDLPFHHLTLIGFSKGCIVLNQLVHAFAVLMDQSSEGDLMTFIKSIEVMYWLDGGHSGGCQTWVTGEMLLRSLAETKISIRIHVTPYQVQCDTRPRIGKEEKIFRETLRRMNADIQRTLHFEEEPRSFENHFRVLEVFKRPELP